MNPISYSLHHIVSKIVKDFKAKSVIDMGGNGRMKSFVDFPVVDANISSGIDATKLPFDDNSFDVACSVATLEHIKGQKKFLEESVRVARKGVVHWFPWGKHAIEMEEFRKTLPYKHPCVVPSDYMIRTFINEHPTMNLYPFMNCETHILLLTAIREDLRIQKVYDMALKIGPRKYGTILFGKV